MSAPPFMPLYVADYLADTTHLTTLEHGAYLLLLACMWRAGGSLPADDAKLARFARLSPAQWGRIKGTVLAFFSVEDGALTQGRLTREMDRHTNAVLQRREAASNGGRATALKDKEKALADGMLPACQPELDKDKPPTPLEGEDAEIGPGPRRKPRRAIPVGYPDAEAIAIEQAKARDAGANVDVSRQAERFRNHAISADRRCAAWPAAWRNWMEKEIAEAPKDTSFRPVVELDPWPQRVREFRRNQYWNTTDWGPKPGKPGCIAPQSALEVA